MRIDFDDISLVIKGTTVLDGVTFHVKHGSFVSVLGASGAGKSTLLNILSGLTVQSGGSILFDGKAVDDLPPERRDVTMVFQDSRLFPNMSVLDNVAFPLKVRGVAKTERRERADEMLERVQLGGFGARRVNELSGGQRQRVALARALVPRPRAVLLDEPFNGLDEALREDMRALVLQLHDDLATTMLMVTHDPLEALTMSDRVAYLSHGRLVQVGTPDQTLLSPSSPEVASCFKATSALEGTVANGAFRKGKLSIPAIGTPDGPAIMLRTADGNVSVHAIAQPDPVSVHESATTYACSLGDNPEEE